MFINDQANNVNFDLQGAFCWESFDLEVTIFKNVPYREWTIDFAMDIIKMYCGM